MAKITFMGAGSTVFAKSILGDCMCSPALHDSHIALYDIDEGRLRDSKRMLDTINANVNQGRATITAHLGVANRKEALRGAGYVVNAIQVGGYDPCTITDFEVPKKYGLRQTIADTLGIGGIFRSLRTIPVVLDFARDMEDVCPGALFINYVNPMAMITAGLLRGSGIRGVGLCHSVQGCARWLLRQMEIPEPARLQWHVAGINHQAWLLSITDGGKDLYPLIKERARQKLDQIHRMGGGRKVEEMIRRDMKEKGVKFGEHPSGLGGAVRDMVRLTCMLRLGYYITESSEHNAEYMPYWIKGTHPELIERYNIPLDEYPRRCIEQIDHWNKRSAELVANPTLDHKRGSEFGSYIIEAMETGAPIRVHGNIMNTGLVTNLPAKACVEVPCLVDRNGVQGCFVGDLPEPCAAMNRTNINVQVLTVEAALTRKKDLIYQAAMMDPHTAAELTLDQIVSLCDDLIAAHGDWMPRFS
jgi:alpha-galactosidase